MDGFVQAGCPDCLQRETERDIPLMAQRIAESPAGRGYEADPGALREAMHKAWPLDTDFKRGRLAVWALLKPKEG
jgi:hypothetical protein